MAYTDATPWHGLGNRLAANQPLDVWAERAGMNWRIEETEVLFTPGDSIADIPRTLAFPSQKVLYRSDTNVPLSVVSGRYQVVQPAEILEFYRDLTEVGGYELETAGVLKEGKKFWALARTGHGVSLPGKDTVNGYLLLATACDGTLATTAQFTSVRVVCNNTLSIALGDSSGAVKVPHRTQFDADAVKRQLGIAISSWDDFMVRMKALAARKVGATTAEQFFRRLLAYPTSQGIHATSTPAASHSQTPVAINERAMKGIWELYSGQGLGAKLASSDGTAWGLVNSVTEFVDHHRRARSADHRLDAAWFGQGAALKQQAWDEALKLVA